MDNGGYEKCYEHALEMIKFLETQVNTYSNDISIARSYEEIRQNEADGKISVIATIEEGGILNDKMERLHGLYERGIRSADRIFAVSQTSVKSSPGRFNITWVQISNPYL